MENIYICPHDRWNPQFYITPKAMKKLVEFFNKRTPQSENALIEQALQTLVELKDYYINEHGGPKLYNDIAFAIGIFAISIAAYFPIKEGDLPIFILNVYGDGKIDTMKNRNDLIPVQIPLNLM